MDRPEKYHARRAPTFVSKYKLGTPLQLTRKESSRTRMIDANEYPNVDPDALVKEKPRQNEYCLPTEKEIRRRKELNNEFSRIHELSEDTCNWLVTKGFQVSSVDRRNLSALMKTCLDPLPFSSIGKKPKELTLEPPKMVEVVPNTVKLSESERFGYLDQSGDVGSALKDYIKVQMKGINSKVIKLLQLPEDRGP